MEHKISSDDFYQRVKNRVKQVNLEKKNNKDKDEENVTIGKIVSEAGISIDSYNGLKKGNKLPPADVVYKIAAKLNIGMEFLLTGSSLKPESDRPFGKEAELISVFNTYLSPTGQSIVLDIVKALRHASYCKK